MVQTVAEALDLTFNRIQFTPDLMPSDITGTEIIEEDLTTGPPGLPLRQGPDLRQRGAGRRDQPHAAEDPGGAAAGDAGAPGHRRRHHLPPARAVLRARHPESRSSRRAPTRCPRRSSTGSCSSSGSATRAGPRKRRSSSRPPAAPGPASSRCSTRQRCWRCRRWSAGCRSRGGSIRAAVNLARMTRPGDSEAPAFVKEYVDWGAGPRASQYLVLGAKARAAMAGRPMADLDDVRASRPRCSGTAW